MAINVNMSSKFDKDKLIIGFGMYWLSNMKKNTAKYRPIVGFRTMLANKKPAIANAISIKVVDVIFFAPNRSDAT